MAPSGKEQKRSLITVPMKQPVTQLSALWPLITCKPEVTLLEASSPPDQPRRSLHQPGSGIGRVTFPKLFLKLLDVERAVKFQA